jgi:hypothetical protein
MSAVRSTVGITALDRDLIRSTLNFLHTFLTARDFNVLLPLALDWSSHALKTLIAFSTSLADLGIEAEYFKLFADFFFLGKIFIFLAYWYLFYLIQRVFSSFLW